MQRVFVDAFYWVAVIHRKDASNTAVPQFTLTLKDTWLVTTDEVLTEVPAARCRQ